MAQATGPFWRPVAAAAAVTAFIAVLGGTLTDLGPWYQSLQQPGWKPPDMLFGPAWTSIYACCVLAFLLAWRRVSSREAREWLIGLFALNGFLNVLWSLLFFRLRRPDWAALEAVALWFSIVALMVLLSRMSRTASVLMLPYLAWVTIAAALTWTVSQLNGPFG
jgi:tryptophan-rich sensory protein